MQNDDKHILERLDHKDGITVPDGYFEDFAAKMSAKLPYRPEIEEAAVAPKRTLWQRFRPYVYMAAMFGGVWCMLKLFVIMAGADKASLNIEDDPALSKVAANEQFVEDYIIDDVSNWDVYHEMVEDSVSLYYLLDSAYNANPDEFVFDDINTLQQ